MLEIKELILHPIQLESVELIECNVKKNCEEILEGNIAKIIMKSWGEVDEDNSCIGNTYLKLKIEFEKNIKPYKIKLLYKGKCSLSEKDRAKDFKAFLELQGTKLLLPYMKATLSEVMTKMGIKPINIPTIDVLETMKRVVKD